MVTDIQIGSTNWTNPTFLAALGAGNDGYSIPDGAGFPGQATPLPWVGMNRLYVEFSEEIVNIAGDPSFVVSLWVDDTADDTANATLVSTTVTF